MGKETLEEAAENHQCGGYDWQKEKRKSFIDGAKWMKEQAKAMHHKEVELMWQQLLRNITTKHSEVTMSNYKQSMKLYTEDQLKEAFNCGRLYQGIKGDANIYHLIDKLTPIELPSDEEIDEAIFPHMELNIKVGFIEGALWMRNKIQGGNNEQQ